MNDAPENQGFDLVRLLAGYPAFSDVAAAELEWLSSHGSLTTYDAGQVITHPGEVIEVLWICLSGALAIDVDRGAGPRRTLEWRAGDVGGILPYSRMSVSPGSLYALDRTQVFHLDRALLADVTRNCPAFTAMTVHVMIDRARVFRTGDLHDEKMVSLGRMAAGLAHELNNPASAAVRAAKLLESEISACESAGVALGAGALDDGAMAEIDRLRGISLEEPGDVSLSAIARARREDRFMEWLETRGLDPDLAVPLAETSLAVEHLDHLAEAVPEEAWAAALSWIAKGAAVRALTRDIGRATGRIHALVSAVKRFSYMDRVPRRDAVDVRTGIADTLAVLGSKARTKSVEIRVAIEPGLPTVDGTGSELNQIWLNLIDNALDAVPNSGHIEIGATAELGWVVVRIVDNGAGIPAEIVDKIFDPFFTTKPPGKGTGLGLQIARDLVGRNGGEIDVDSRQGRTEFRVRFPPGTLRGEQMAE